MGSKKCDRCDAVVEKGGVYRPRYKVGIKPIERENYNNFTVCQGCYESFNDWIYSDE